MPRHRIDRPRGIKEPPFLGTNLSLTANNTMRRSARLKDKRSPNSAERKARARGRNIFRFFVRQNRLPRSPPLAVAARSLTPADPASSRTFVIKTTRSHHVAHHPPSGCHLRSASSLPQHPLP